MTCLFIVSLVLNLIILICVSLVVRAGLISAHIIHTNYNFVLLSVFSLAIVTCIRDTTASMLHWVGSIYRVM
jgi:hypothetical protein